MLKEIGYRVRAARRAKGMSQAELAEALHVSSPYISNIEQGKQAMSVLTLCGICETLEVSADWILCTMTQKGVAAAGPEAGKIPGDCTPEQRGAMLRLLQSMKDVLDCG